MLTPQQRYLLPKAIPLAVKWAKKHEVILMGTGQKLIPELATIARVVGVWHPESVRFLLLAQLPQPEDPLLLELGKEVKYISPHTEGITFGHGIYIRQDCVTKLSLWAHELTHVSQHERLGGIEKFVDQYCRELADFEYENAPLEVEAKQREKAFG